MLNVLQSNMINSFSIFVNISTKKLEKTTFDYRYKQYKIGRDRGKLLMLFMFGSLLYCSNSCSRKDLLNYCMNKVQILKTNDKVIKEISLEVFIQLLMKFEFKGNLFGPFNVEHSFDEAENIVYGFFTPIIGFDDSDKAVVFNGYREAEYFFEVDKDIFGRKRCSAVLERIIHFGK